MTDLIEMEKIAKTAVKQLRSEELMNGIPFMINSNDLPSTQCYIEYPDGRIDLVSMLSGQRDFKIIRELSAREASALRKKYNLTEIYA